MCRSRRELSNAYFVAKFGFDTADNHPCQACPLSAYRSPRCVESRIPGTPLKATDYAHLPYGKERFGIAMVVFAQLTASEGNSLLLSRVGSVLSPQARSAMHSLRLRFLNFLHEDPHRKYVHITGSGGAQALVLGPPPATESSLPRLRAEISAALLNEVDFR